VFALRRLQHQDQGEHPEILATATTTPQLLLKVGRDVNAYELRLYGGHSLQCHRIHIMDVYVIAYKLN